MRYTCCPCLAFGILLTSPSAHYDLAPDFFFQQIRDSVNGENDIIVQMEEISLAKSVASARDMKRLVAESILETDLPGCWYLKCGFVKRRWSLMRH